LIENNNAYSFELPPMRWAGASILFFPLTGHSKENEHLTFKIMDDGTKTFTVEQFLKGGDKDNSVQIKSIEVEKPIIQPQQTPPN